jgi:hypothetical protein
MHFPERGLVRGGLGCFGGELCVGMGAPSGARLSERTLLPGDGAQLGATRFGDWLSQQAPAR